MGYRRDRKETVPMITKTLFNNSSKLKRLTGLNKDQFNELCSRVEPLWKKAEEQRLSSRKRERAIGGGRKYQLKTIEEKVLCFLVWMKLYPSYWFLGFIFRFDASNAKRHCDRIKPLVRQAADARLNRELSQLHRQVKRKKISSWEDLEREFPEVAEILIDGSEQPIRRPKQVNKRNAKAKQKKHYSGKKKRHTKKVQVAVNRSGKIMHLSNSVGGKTHDYKLLKNSGLMEKIPKQSKKLTDTGYDGMSKDFPDHDGIVQPIKRRRGSPKLTKTQKQYNRIVSKKRILVEHVISRMKKYAVMGQQYRHNLDQYDKDAKAVAALINFRLSFA